jgi:uncharacterized protein (DUF4415 family)
MERNIVAMPRKQPVPFDDDNPEWSKEDFARARPISDFPDLAAAFPKARGRPVGSTKHDAKRSVTLRLDPDVLEAFKASGAGWHSRINKVLREAMGL